MNKLMSLLIFFLLLGQLATSQSINTKIKVSAFKKVLVEIPSELEVTSIQPGMDKKFLKITETAKNVYVFQVMPGKDFPPSNCLIICDNRMFNLSIEIDNNLERYHYGLKTEDGVLLNNNVSRNHPTKVQEQNAVAKPQIQDQETLTIEEEINNSSVFNFNSEYLEQFGDTTEFAVELEYFSDYRAPFGKVTSENVSIYVNNLLTTTEFIYISIVLDNQSNQIFDINYLKFLKHEKTKKHVQAIESGPEIISSSLVNIPDMQLLPKESTLLVYEFDRFSLVKGNTLNVIVSESSGIRTLELNISGKKFNDFMVSR